MSFNPNANVRNQVFRQLGNLAHVLNLVETDGLKTWLETMNRTKLNYTVSKHQNSSIFFPDQKIDSYGLYRDDDKSFVSQVGGTFEVVQTLDMFQWVDKIVEVDGRHYVGAGERNNGKDVFCVVYLGEFRINGNDLVKVFGMFEDGRGSGSARFRLIFFREVCANGMHKMVSFSDKKFRHTKNVLNRMAEVASNNNILDFIAEYKLSLQKLANRKIGEDLVQEILNELYPLPSADAKRKSQVNQKHQDAILANYRDNDNGAFQEQEETAWALLNAITNYENHSRPQTNTSSREGVDASVVRATNSIFGGSGNLMENALDLILEKTDGLPEYVYVPKNPVSIVVPSSYDLLNEILDAHPSNKG